MQQFCDLYMALHPTLQEHNYLLVDQDVEKSPWDINEHYIAAFLGINYQYYNIASELTVGDATLSFL